MHMKYKRGSLSRNACTNLTQRENLVGKFQRKRKCCWCTSSAFKLEKNQDGAALGPLFYGTNPLLFNISRAFPLYLLHLLSLSGWHF